MTHPDRHVVEERRGKREGFVRESVEMGLPAFPEIVIEANPAVDVRASHTARWRVETTTFHYVRYPEVPFLPDDVVAAFRRRIEAYARQPGAFVGHRLEVWIVAGTGDNARDFPIRWALRGDLGIPGGSWEDVWRGLRQAVDRADFYDSQGLTDFAEIHRMGAGPLESLMDNFRVVVIDKRPLRAGCPGAAKTDPKLKHVLIEPAASPGLCGQACLAYHEASPKTRDNMRVFATGTANKYARQIATEIGVEGAMGLADFATYASLRPHARVLVYGLGNELLLDTGLKSLTPDNIYLFFHADHCRYINPARIGLLYETSINQRLKWCATCLAPYTEKRGARHFCGVLQCPGCPAKFPTPEEQVAHSTPSTGSCAECGERFRFGGCEAAHRCVYSFCAECGQAYRIVKAYPHQCGRRYCRFCQESFPREAEHRCHIAPLRPKEAPEGGIPCYALDFECTVDAEGKHAIALAVIARTGPPVPGEQHTWVLQGAEAFSEWLGAHCMKKAVVVAHNGGPYDFVLVLGAILESGTNRPRKVIFAGEKIMYLQYERLTFVDTRRHVAGSLAALAETFALAGLSKGHFPYRFFSPENSRYVGDVPGAEWFEPRSREAPDFAAWHAGFAPGGYDILAECIRYCTNDVALLARSVEAYRAGALAACGIDPLESVTIAAYALKVYRTRFMPPGGIVVLSAAEQDFVAPALKGGRTDALQLDRSWSPAEVASGRYGCYVDVNSLYPAVQAFDTMPGAVVSTVAPFVPPLEGADARAYLEALQAADQLAILEYSITPPPDLHIPVLLTRSAEGRLLAALDPIAHGRDTSVEIAAALGAGYTGLVIHRAIVFEARRDLFRSYVDTYTALKEKHSPGGEEPNPGKRTIAKIMLNSLWGKFAQQGRPQEHRYIRGLREWDALVEKFQAGDINLSLKASTDTWALAAIEAPQAVDRLRNTTNIALACFVTSHARLRLYAELSRLGPRAIYHDTDSVIYERDPIGYNVPTGSRLGEWKDETGGVPITEIVCLGPKTYAYRTARGDTTARCKGFPSDWGHLEMYRTILDAALASAPIRLACEYTEFRRQTKVAAPLITTATARRFLQFEYIKRHIVSRSLTLPLGHAGIPQPVSLEQEILELLALMGL